jgi:hypothetical protein
MDPITAGLLHDKTELLRIVNEEKESYQAAVTAHEVEGTAILAAKKAGEEVSAKRIDDSVTQYTALVARMHVLNDETIPRLQALSDEYEKRFEPGMVPPPATLTTYEERKLWWEEHMIPTMETLAPIAHQLRTDTETIQDHGTKITALVGEVEEVKKDVKEVKEDVNKTYGHLPAKVDSLEQGREEDKKRYDDGIHQIHKQMKNLAKNHRLSPMPSSPSSLSSDKSSANGASSKVSSHDSSDGDSSDGNPPSPAIHATTHSEPSENPGSGAESPPATHPPLQGPDHSNDKPEDVEAAPESRHGPDSSAASPGSVGSPPVNHIPLQGPSDSVSSTGSVYPLGYSADN